MKLGLGVSRKDLRTRTIGDGPRGSLSFSFLKLPRGKARAHLFPASLTSHLPATYSSPPQGSSTGLPGGNCLGIAEFPDREVGVLSGHAKHHGPFLQKIIFFTLEKKVATMIEESPCTLHPVSPDVLILRDHSPQLRAKKSMLGHYHY